MATLSYTLGFVLAIVMILLKTLFSHLKERRTRPRYPPGPPGRLFGGNLKDIPVKKPWIAYADWAKQYGDVMHLQMSGDHAVILSSAKASNDLLDKRSRIYSARGNEDVVKMTGWHFNMAFQDYGEAWRKNRRLYQQHFRPDAVASRLRPSIEKCITVLLNNLIDSPESLSGGLALTTMYGIKVTDGNNPLLLLAKKTVHTLDDVFAPHFVSIVSRFPFVDTVPEWMPFFGPARRVIDETRKYLHDLREIPVQNLQRDMNLNAENGGLVAEVMREKLGNEESTEELEAIKDMAAIVFAASADTTLSSTGSFFLAMARNPEVQRKAQDEIDAVVGRDRLPTLEDRKYLPYIEAIYRETMRTNPAVPLGLPHYTTEDDFYNGHFIPKGTAVSANIW
ncbi:cytochrome p450 [Paramarasmius palmivorus]|uniref:Cytochrome p450 n=1 Tax=Paramarasmius palmivorus TaxID=297713 RepID=A0AAW0CLZ9_9AGAR